MIDLRDSTDPEIAIAATVLATLDAAARTAGVPLVVVGATARNILSAGLLGRLPERSTRDVDIAVAVASWPEFRRLTDRLERRGRGEHTFVVDGVEVDVVPYGGIEGPDRTVLWPDDVRMNVLGLREAYAAAQDVRMPGDVVVKVPSIPGLAVLKLVTWSDRHLLTRRDAIDLETIIGWYSTGTFLDSLYAEEADLLAVYDFEIELAGAHLLGSHMARLLGPASAEAVAGMLDDEALARLANDMGRTSTGMTQLLQALRAGIRPGVEPTGPA